MEIYTLICTKLCIILFMQCIGKIIQIKQVNSIYGNLLDLYVFYKFSIFSLKTEILGKYLYIFQSFFDAQTTKEIGFAANTGNSSSFHTFKKQQNIQQYPSNIHDRFRVQQVNSKGKKKISQVFLRNFTCFFCCD